MNLNAVIIQLRSQATSFSNRIAGAAEFAAIEEGDLGVTLPFAWVIPTGASAEKNKVLEEFSVAVAFSNLGDDERGQAVTAALDTTRTELFAALLDWAPDSDHENVQLEGESLRELTRGILWYRWDFSCARIVRAVISFQVTVSVATNPGVAVSTILSELTTAVEAAISGSTSELASDLVDDWETLDAGDTKYQLLGAPIGGEFDSNVEREIVGVVVKVHHRLGASEAERDYTRDEMLTSLTNLLDPDTWRTTNVYDVVEVPDFDFPGDLVRI